MASPTAGSPAAVNDPITAFKWVSTAMILFSIIQLFTNGWRVVQWRSYVLWPIFWWYILGATLAAGEGPVAPSQGDASQCALSTIVGQADPAIVEEAGEVVPAPEHVIHRLQDLGGAREGFALTQQPGVHVLEKRRRRGR